MTLKKLYFEMKDHYDNCVILIKYGNFYRTFDQDTLIMNYLFNYKICGDKVGFPIIIINDVIKKLNNNCISVIIVNKRDDIKYFNCTSNHYYELLELSKNHYFIDNRIKEINDIVDDLLNNNINNYYKIKDFLDEL